MPPKQNNNKDNKNGAAAAASSPSTSTTTSSSANKPPTGKVETVTPTIQQLLSLNTEHIRDEEAIASIKKLQKLRNDQNKNRQELRALIDKQQQSRAENNNNSGASANGSGGAPSKSKQFDALDDEFKKLTLEKNTAGREMDLLRLEQTTFSRNSDRVKMIDSEYEVVLRDARPLRQKLAEAEARLADAEATVDANKNAKFGGFASASAVEEELQRIAVAIETATTQNDTKLVAVHAKTQNALMKAKREFLKNLELEDSISGLKKSVEKARRAVEQANAKVESVDKERTELRDAVKNAKSFNDEFTELRKRLSKLNNQLDENRNKRRALAKQADKERSNPEFEARSKEIDAKRKTQDEIAGELDSLTKATVTFKRIEYDVELRGDLVGRKGATIGQFQQDFGVYVDFDQNGWALIAGGEEDVDAAIEGIKEMCNTLRHARQQDTIKFDPLQASQIIGSGGANIRRFENLSGASIKVDSAAGVATIIGTPENIATAKQLFDDHFKNNAEVVIPFRRDLIDAILGRGGATVRKIEQDSKCRRIRVDKDNSVVYCYGTQEACDFAKAEYQKILAEYSTPPYTQKVDDKQVRIIIGAGGATITELQKTTGAKIDIVRPGKNQRFGQLTARGSKESLEALKKALDDLLIREEIKINVPSSLFGALVDASFNTKSNKSENNNNDDDDNNNVCVLEEIRQSSSADQVSLIRSESCVVIRGKREAVQSARHSLERFMIENRPEVVRVNFCPALFGVLTTKKSNNGSSPNLLDSLVAEAKNKDGSTAKMLNIEINKASSYMEVVGLDKSLVQAASSELKKLIDDLGKNCSSFIVANSSVKAIVGTGGATIRDLQSTYKAEIHINRETSEVSVYSADEEDLKGCVEAIEKLAK